MLGCFIFRPDHNTRVMQIYEGLIVPHGKVHHASKLPDACLQFGHHFNPIGDSDDEDEDDEHLDHDAITLPGAGLQLGDHLDQVGVLLEESSQPERDVRRVHLVMMVISVLVVIMIMVMVMTTSMIMML